VRKQNDPPQAVAFRMERPGCGGSFVRAAFRKQPHGTRLVLLAPWREALQDQRDQPAPGTITGGMVIGCPL
jgi:hypothetical protein